MKAKEFIKAALIALILVPNLFLAQAASAAGGVTDGGGNVLPDEPMTQPQISYLLSRSKPATLYTLNALKYWLEVGSDQERKLGRKLYHGSKTIYQALETAEYMPLETGDCEAIGGAEHDASALKFAPRICFSLEALAGKLKQGSGQQKLIALIVHELSHQAGANEDEAIEVQNLVETNARSGLIDRAEIQASDFKSNVSWLVSQIKDLQKANSKTAFCMQLTATLAQSFDLAFKRSWGDVYETGFILLNSEQNRKLVDETVKAVNLAQICAQGNQETAGDLEKFRKVIAGKSTATTGEFLRLMIDGDVSWIDFSEYTTKVRNVLRAGFASPVVRQEISDMMNLAKAAHDSMK